MYLVNSLHFDPWGPENCQVSGNKFLYEYITITRYTSGYLVKMQNLN
jgi:hypothetical protein